MLSSSSKYAIKAVLYLALHASESNKIRAKNIGGPINVPQAYIAKLLQELSRHNLVSSTKGPHGGFYLSDENMEQPVINIIDVIDGKKKIESCMLSLEDCNEGKPCPLHKLVGPMRSKFIKSMSEKTIHDLSMDLKDKKSFLPL
tara:strand:+ start:231 stop:662 length:432 start_codon:yes stop_codon:yes gene_type:complete